MKRRERKVWIGDDMIGLVLVMIGSVSYYYVKRLVSIMLEVFRQMHPVSRVGRAHEDSDNENEHRHSYNDLPISDVV